MLKLICLLCLVTVSSPLYAASSRTVTELFRQAADNMVQELQRIPGLPAELCLFSVGFVSLSSKYTGALAEYQPERKQIVFFRRGLEQWLKQPEVSALDTPARAALLARCLTPVYVHEMSHARDQKWGETNGFFWPVTLKDEFIASFWQLYVMRHYSLIQPDYYKNCQPLLPANIPAPENWEEYIYRRYAAQKGAALPPPPLTQTHIEQLIKEGYILFEGKKFYPSKKQISFKRFLKKRASWIQIKKKDLPEFTESELYLRYLKLDNQRNNEIKNNFLL